MKIYFDNTLIDPIYYVEFKQNNKIFNDSDNFVLGKTFCNSISLKLAKTGVSSIPEEVKITINNANYGFYIVDMLQENDGICEFTLVDKMVKFNFNYNAKPLIDSSTTGYVTLLEILQDMCTKAGVVLDNNSTTFLGYNKHISWYDDTITAREYLEYIAELNCGYARINKNGKLELIRFSNTPVQTININDTENYKIGEYHKISRVVYDNGLGTFDPVGTNDNDTLYLNSNNVYITEQADLTNIYNIIKLLDFNSITIEKCIINDNVIGGDTLKLTDGTNNYYFMAQIDNFYNGGFIGGYNFKISSNVQAETTIKNDLRKSVKSIKTIVDRAEAEIEIVADKVETLEENIELLKVDIDTNVVVVPVPDNKTPMEATTYNVGYSVKYLGVPITVQPTTSDSHTGITCNISNNQITFSTTAGTQIPLLDNKYTFTWTYLGHTLSKVIMLSLVVAPESQQQIEIRSIAPTDTTKLWLDTSRSDEKTTDQLKRYNSTTQEWEIVNDFTDEINELGEAISTTATTTTDLSIKTNAIESSVITMQTGIDELNNDIVKVNETIVKQTTDAITTFFNSTVKPIQDALNDTELDLTTTKEDLANISSYISQKTVGGNACIEIGSQDSNMKMRLFEDRLVFYESEQPVAYITDKSLYITESTVLTKINLASWLAEEDSSHNLNMKWNGGV